MFKIIQKCSKVLMTNSGFFGSFVCLNVLVVKHQRELVQREEGYRVEARKRYPDLSMCSSGLI